MVVGPMFRSAAVVAVGLVLAGCSTVGGPSGEQEAGGGTHGAERASVPNSRPHITGFVTVLEPAPGRELPARRILVEEKPGSCLRGNLREGCDRLYLDVTDKTRIFLKAGDGEKALSPASVADLQRGQRVHAWHTGALTKSYPGQGRARVLVIDANDATPERTANSASRR